MIWSATRSELYCNLDIFNFHYAMVCLLKFSFVSQFNDVAVKLCLLSVSWNIFSQQKQISDVWHLSENWSVVSAFLIKEKTRSHFIGK